MKEFYHITIEELIEIKKISKMKVGGGLSKMRELRDKHNFTDTQAINLYHIAKNFKTTLLR